MKDKKKVAELLTALKAEMTTEFELHLVEEVEKRLNGDVAKIRIIDEIHQEFAGHLYTKQKSGGGHYRYDELIHRAVWQYNNGIIPEGYIIHHIDGNKSNNDISNLQLMTGTEHRKLHNRIAKSTRTHVCKICGKQFQTTKSTAFVQKYCSDECRAKAYTKKYVCIVCGKEFLSDKFNDRKYCSLGCASKHAWEIAKKTGKIRNNNCQRDKYGRFVGKK